MHAFPCALKCANTCACTLTHSLAICASFEFNLNGVIPAIRPVRRRSPSARCAFCVSVFVCDLHSVNLRCIRCCMRCAFVCLLCFFFIVLFCFPSFCFVYLVLIFVLLQDLQAAKNSWICPAIMNLPRHHEFGPPPQLCEYMYVSEVAVCKCMVVAVSVPITHSLSHAQHLHIHTHEHTRTCTSTCALNISAFNSDWVALLIHTF